MKSLVETAVARRVTVFMTTLAVLAFGVVGYSRLALELFPDISYPSITVQTDYPDTAPEEVEIYVTRPIEEAVGVLSGLQTVHSISRAGVSEVNLEFDWGSDMDLLALDVREKLDRAQLPLEAEDPVVLRFDPSLDPILRFAISGDQDLGRMRYLAEHRIKLELETMKGVASAQVKGGLEEEIQIEVDQERLAALGIPIEAVENVVGASNLNRPGGALRGVEDQYLIRTINEFEDLAEIENLIISRSGSATVRLREVAEVRAGHKEREEITRAGGRESVEMSVYKEADANTVTVARAVRARLEEWSPKLPEGYTLTTLFDQSRFVQSSLDGVRDAALAGGALAVLVLFAFLRDFRSTLIVGASIPVSVVATFLVMYRLDISLNIMSLGGLTLGIGMLVDSSIVVLESVYRKRKRGLSLSEAAVEGTAEVGPAVIASTLTTVAVFLPIVFVEGIAGQLFRDQALTVTISLLASLAVAMTLIPMLSSLGSRAANREGPDDPPAGGEMTLGFFSRAYDRLVRGAVRWRWVTLTLSFGLFAFSLGSVERLETELIPAIQEGEFFFEVNLPEGTSLTKTDRVLGEMEEAALRFEEVERVYSTAGSRLVSGGLSLNTAGENLGQINIVLGTERDPSEEEQTAEALRRKFEDVPDLEIKFGRPSYFSLRTPVEVILFGEDLDVLWRYSAEIARDLEAIEGLVDVRSSLEAGNPEIQVRFDRDRLALLGLNAETLSQTLQSRVQGVVPTRFKEHDRQIDIRIRNAEERRRSLRDIRNLILEGSDGEAIRLLSLAEVVETRGPAEIHRLQQQRAAVISANLEGRTLGSVIRDVRRVLAAHSNPKDVSAELGGQNREMEISFSSLRFAIGLAIFLVYLVMASTFESFVHPFVVLFTIPLSLVGVVAGLLITGTSISVIVLIGAILLVGIVVNNAIVLIDTINRLRGQGLSKTEAIVRAGHIRLRPILMTTLTTILGLLPMALGWGDGSELRAPLAVTVASGLALATVLTLVVIPATYSLVPDGQARKVHGTASDA